MDWSGFLLLIHIVAAMAWFGGSMFVVTRFGPAMKAAGPAALPVQVALLKRGGVSRYFVPVALITVASGIILFINGPWATNTSAAGIFMMIGSAAGLAALIIGATRSGPLEAKMQAIVKTSDGKPTQSQGLELAALTAQAGFASRIILALLSLAILGMLARLYL